jgi:hypothetical protein
MSWMSASRCLAAVMALAIGLLIESAARADEPTKPAASARRGAAALERALAEPTELEFIETPLVEVLAYLSDRHAIDIQVDASGLEDAGVSKDTPISWNLRGPSLRSALNLLMDELDLAWTLSNETLIVTSPEQSEYSLISRTYRIADLVNAEHDVPFDEAAILDLVLEMIDSEFECIYEDGRAFELIPGALVITTNRREHDLVTNLLSDLQQAAADAPPSAVKKENSEQKLARLLDSPTEGEFQETPLAEIVAYFSDRHGVQFLLDKKSLEVAGIAPDTPISVKVSDVSLADGLDLILREVELTWHIWNETVEISTAEKVNNSLDVVVYPVADLIARGISESELQRAAAAVPAIVAEGVADDGGFGAVGIAPGRLVVCHTDHAHREIAALLAELRKLPPPADGAGVDPFRFQIYVVRGVAPAELVQPIQLIVAPGAWGGAADPSSIVAVAGLAAAESAATTEEPDATDDAPKPKFEELLNGQSDLSKLAGNQPTAPHSGWLLIRQRASVQRRIEKLLDRMDVLVEVK